MQVLGTHILVELEDCNTNKINDVYCIEKVMLNAVKAAGATILGHQFHVFKPHGVSGVVVLAESHMSIHTWPEYNFASCDIYMCGDRVDPMAAVLYLTQNLGAKTTYTNKILRGTTKNRPLPGSKLVLPHQ